MLSIIGYLTFLPGQTWLKDYTYGAHNIIVIILLHSINQII